MLKAYLDFIFFKWIILRVIQYNFCEATRKSFEPIENKYCDKVNNETHFTIGIIIICCCVYRPTQYINFWPNRFISSLWYLWSW
jgi:hypothetical protein